MSPELITAIKERLQAGQSREEIESAVLAMGHAKEVFAAALTLAEHDLSNKDKAALPQARLLFKNAWKFTQSRFDLVALLFIPLLLETLGSFWFERLPEGERFVTVPLALLFLATGVAYVVTIATALKIVAAKDEAEKTLPVAFTWMTKNALSLLWVFVLSGLLIFGGLLFFIIPGLIVAISVTFAQYVFVDEEKTGMAALLASHTLVKGRWWKVVRKIFGFVVLTLIPLFLFGILYGLLTAFVGEGVYVTLGGELATQALSAVMSLMSIHAMYHLYKALKDSRGEEAVLSAHTPVRYWIMVGLSGSFAAALIITATFFPEKLQWLEEAATPLEEMENGEVPPAFTGLQIVAAEYARSQATGYSYQGVCDKLTSFAEAEGEVTCNSNETDWAFEVVTPSGDRFCADTATPGKQTRAPLGDKTECIAVGG